jgi:hypothetical protein
MLPITKLSVEGNEQVVKLMEKTLVRAKEGRIDFAAIITCSGPMDSSYEYSGICGRESIVNFSIDNLKMRILNDFVNRMTPVSALPSSADKWCYNISKCPASYDIFAILINAKMDMLREGAPAPLKIYFYWGKNIKEDEALITPFRKQMFYHVVRPALKLFGAVETDEAMEGRQREHYSYMPVVEAALRGEKVPKLFAPVIDWQGKATPVVITLRETEHWPHRNSNLVEWFKFAAWLQERGERVIFVRDTRTMNEPLGADFEVYPEASSDLLTRMSLYCSSKHNYFVGNGPGCMCWFSENPWTSLIAPSSDDPYFPNTPDGIRVFTGLTVGEQFPWSRPRDQKIVWDYDTFEILRNDWLALMGQNPVSAIAA